MLVLPPPPVYRYRRSRQQLRCVQEFFNLLVTTGGRARTSPEGLRGSAPSTGAKIGHEPKRLVRQQATDLAYGKDKQADNDDRRRHTPRAYRIDHEQLQVGQIGGEKDTG